MDVRVEIIIKNTYLTADEWAKGFELCKLRPGHSQGHRIFLEESDEIRTSVIEDSWTAWDNGAEPDDSELAEELRERERNLRY